MASGVAAPPPDGKAIFVKGVPLEAAEADIRSVFAIYGDVVEVARPADKNFCFVTFGSQEEAQAAVDAGAQEIAGESCAVDLRRGARSQTPRLSNTVPAGTSTSLYIPSVAEEATEEDIRAAFETFGDIKSIKFRSRIGNRDARSFVFVEFSHREAVEAALAAGPHRVAGEEVAVQERLSVPRTGRERREHHQENGATEGGGGGRQRREKADGERSGGRRRGGGGGGGGGAGGGAEWDAQPAREGRLPVPPKQENSVYIRGFATDTTEEDIRLMFGKYGEISSVIMRVKGEADDVRTWAFVEYEGADKVAAAVAGADGAQLHGVPVAVEARKSEPKLFRPTRSGRGRGRYRGGGGRGGGNRRRPIGDEGHDDA